LADGRCGGVVFEEGVFGFEAFLNDGAATLERVVDDGAGFTGRVRKCERGRVRLIIGFDRHGRGDSVEFRFFRRGTS